MSPFFRSTRYPHLTMNRFGVIFAPNGHPDGVDYWGRSFEVVPLRSGMLSVQSEVEDEARQAGYTVRYVGDEVLWSKPESVAHA